MNAILNVLAPHSKAVAVALAIGVALIAEAAGVDVGLDLDSLWQQLGALALPTAAVWLAPANKARRGQG